ncbi:MAG: AAA family ATPase [Myxococcaceae bacterium]|nr:AAA family ATPase [Myxococcaceae bacterium]
MRAKHGLVIGKFYPPHDGHALLVRTAAEQSERVTVIAMAATVESIPLETRLGWLREIHAAEPNVRVVGTVDDVPVNYADDAVWQAHVELMRAALQYDAPVDAVFTSEPYGDELARRLGARHVSVDPSRSGRPVSGTKVRADPPGHWQHLAPCVRAWFSRRLVIIGAESTGKSTLAAELARRLGTVWVPEHGRDYTEEKLAALRRARPDAPMEELTWSTDDFVAIARAQQRLEDEAARRSGPVLVCDTDTFTTGVWHERYMGVRAPAVEQLAAAATASRRYLLTHPDDVPFEQDGIRDGEHLRAWMTETFVRRLSQTGRPWQWLRGSREQRLELAVAAAKVWLAEGWQLAAPLG